MVLSADPETISRPSGLKATEFHPILMSVELVRIGVPGLEIPHPPLSADPETMRRPSGLNATEFTQA